jgi:hypothetical protein
MRSLLVTCSIVSLLFSVPVSAQSTDEILGIFGSVVNNEIQKAEKKRVEEERQKALAERQRMLDEARQRRQSSTNLTSIVPQVIQPQIHPPNSVNPPVQKAQIYNQSNINHSDVVDDEGYGAVFDALEKAEAAKTDSQKFEELKPHLVSGRPNVEQCQEFQNLVMSDNYEAISYALELGARGNRFSVNGPAIANCFRMDSGHIPFAPDRIKRVFDNARDMYNGGLTMATYQSYRSGAYDNNPLYDERRVSYFKRSADLDYVLGQQAYASIMIEKGDKKTAFIYLNKAAEKGDITSIKALKSVYGYEFVSKNKEPSVAELSGLTTRGQNSQIVSVLKSDDMNDKINLTRYVSGSSLNYRDAPNGNKLGSLARSSKISVYKQQGKWLRITESGLPEKWVHEDFVSSIKPADLPSSSTKPYKRLSVQQCGDLRISRLLSKTKQEYNSHDRQMTRGGCNSEREALKKQWEWVR